MTTFTSVWDAIEDSQSGAASMKARAQLMRGAAKDGPGLEPVSKGLRGSVGTDAAAPQ
jgi:hypothetical protein